MHTQLNSFKLQYDFPEKGLKRSSSKATTMWPKCRYFKGGNCQSLRFLRQMTASTSKPIARLGEL
jgi:hypothetical protein